MYVNKRVSFAEAFNSLIPNLAQFSVAYSLEKQERAWYLFSREWYQDRKDGNTQNTTRSFCKFSPFSDYIMVMWEKIPGSPRFFILQVTENWTEPGNEAWRHVHIDLMQYLT